MSYCMSLIIYRERERQMNSLRSFLWKVREEESDPNGTEEVHPTVAQTPWDLNVSHFIDDSSEHNNVLCALSQVPGMQ